MYYVPAGIELQPRLPGFGHPELPGLRERVANDRPHGISGQKLLCLLCMRLRADQGLPPAPVWMTFVEGPHHPVFRHEDGRSPHAEHTPESNIHKALKDREAATWTAAGATEVKVEAWRPRAKRRPDVLAVGARLTVAGEIQHTTLTPTAVNRRQNALAAAGDRVVWTTDRDSADVAFLRQVPHLAVPALDDYRLYRHDRTPQLNVISGWTVFETQRCGWSDMWRGGSTRCPITERLEPCGRLHLYPTLNPHAYRPDPDARFPCGSSPDLDHLLEGILTDRWRPYRVGGQRTTWIPTTVYNDVVGERGGSVEAAERPRPPAASRSGGTRVCEQKATKRSTADLAYLTEKFRPAQPLGIAPQTTKPQASPSPVPTAEAPAHGVQLIIPGMQAVEAGALELAAANMAVFVEAVRDRARIESDVRGYTPEVGHPVRDAAADIDGRFGWVLPVNGRDQVILMPGVELVRLRDTEVSAPCLFVNGSAWWWNDAVSMAVPIPPRRT
ncbi:competence protein CoiA family protein [Paractinoplanes atraurantiacus]|uniref:competence protein CoiA family protein n=1 Tax=Paractinoplanes atraurantiacus TaxID=1036182 RepID=UPI000BE434A4|nr:competence protein CoiA family protein [Actinoplanes atraurantiacus]